jgi:4-diphosphocytidyl-2-C-methyl-D-erythritol kinase
LQTTELAPAKINLALHVLGRRADGFHELDSIVAFAQIGDRLSFAAADEWELEIVGPFAPSLSIGGENLVLRAARAFAEAYPETGRKYSITLEKNLPIAAGIGGGSADAAACLRALAAFAGVNDATTLAAIAAMIGSDVPVCLARRTCRMRGLGERIDILETVPQMPAVLVNPGIALSTGDVFARLALRPGRKAFAGLGEGRPLASCRNDLTGSALALAPVVGKVLAALRAEPGVDFARMSGSGATCFGIFASPEAAKEAAQRIADNHPQWWVVPTTIG